MELSIINMDLKILSNSVNKNEDLCKAINNGQIELVKLSLDNGAEVNCLIDDYTPLMIAVKSYSHANHEIIKILIENGADVNLVNKKFKSVLFVACDSGSSSNLIENIKLLIEKGANVNYQREKTGQETENYGFTPLMIIAGRGRPMDIAKLLIENGADVNLKNWAGKMAKDLTYNPEYKKLLTPLVPKVSIITLLINYV